MILKRIRNKKKKNNILLEIHTPNKILYYSDCMSLKEKIKNRFKKKYFKTGRVVFSKGDSYFSFPDNFLKEELPHIKIHLNS